MPRRAQRTRKKGGGIPDGAVYVGRPSKWGNPFLHAQKYLGLDVSLALFRNAVTGYWNPAVIQAGGPTKAVAYDDHCLWRKRLGGHPQEVIRQELRGKDLACWCPLDQPCHADVLLEIANS